uniref:Uncharacterized protein n=1 Tax=Timema poppense TaxID=170557 RepID=A0A7R9DJC4_TIMPO|nr:unnamed protein product [Timema poppensis]
MYKTLETHQFGRFYIGSMPNLNLRDPVIIKQILVKDFVHFFDRNPSFIEKIAPLARNLASLTSSLWRKLRGSSHLTLLSDDTSDHLRMFSRPSFVPGRIC